MNNLTDFIPPMTKFSIAIIFSLTLALILLSIWLSATEMFPHQFVICSEKILARHLS